MKKGDILEIEIEKLAFGGNGIGRVNNQVVFVEGGLPGDKVRARIRKIKHNFITARLTEIINYSPLRRNAPCQHFGECGGCKWQNLDYPQQIRFKREQVLESLQHLASVEPDLVHPTIPSPMIYAYRNKMEFSFTDNRWLTSAELSNPDIKKGDALGLHVPGAFDRIMHIEKCWLQDDMMGGIMNATQQFFKKNPLPIFSLKTHQGLLRFLVIRKSFSRNEYMVNVVTFQEAAESLAAYVDSLIRTFPSIVSVINTVNPRVAQIAFGEEEHVLHGTDHISEKLGEFVFEISANSFFQTNPLQAEKLYGLVAQYTGQDNGMVWDLYSGTGTIALFISGQAQQVVGFELVESAVRDAERNCLRNHIENCRFVSGEIRENISRQSEKPEVIICDPPRSGMHQDIVRAILEVQPRKIVYVSCNPATLARDIKPLTDLYRVVEVQPVDMFPHTYHIESVVRLERR